MQPPLLLHHNFLRCVRPPRVDPAVVALRHRCGKTKQKRQRGKGKAEKRKQKRQGGKGKAGKTKWENKSGAISARVSPQRHSTQHPTGPAFSTGLAVYSEHPSASCPPFPLLPFSTLQAKLVYGIVSPYAMMLHDTTQPVKHTHATPTTDVFGASMGPRCAAVGNGVVLTVHHLALQQPSAGREQHGGVVPVCKGEELLPLIKKRTCTM